MIGRYLNAVKKFKTYAHEIGLGKGGWARVLIDYIIAKWLFGFSHDDYFVKSNGFTRSWYEKKRFFTLKRALWFQRKVNNPEYTNLLENKVNALILFKDFVTRKWLYTPKSLFCDFIDFVSNTPVFIAKPVGGMGGEGIEKYSTIGSSLDEMKTLYNQLMEKDMLLEECLKAHDAINLKTKALSTFRVFTMIDGKGVVHVLKAKYRAGFGDAITDATDGYCIHYPISIKYGVIEGPGINEILKKSDYFYHPGCDKLLVGMRIPMWDRVLDVVTKAAQMIPQVRYIGWDIAITNNSVEIIEGNHRPHHGTFEIMGTERLWWPKLKELI